MTKRMVKKDSRETKDSIRKPTRAKNRDVKEPDVKEAGEKFDFGGLPDRDLKKNLGCG